jgi:hypothetical protein
MKKNRLEEDQAIVFSVSVADMSYHFPRQKIVSICDMIETEYETMVELEPAGVVVKN